MVGGFQRVQFRTTNTGSYGNFLDGIQLTLRPFVQLSLASSSGLESVPSAGLPTLLVSGTATSAISVTINITGGTAVRGTDYITPGGGASFTVTIPAGTYYNSPIALGISITDDSAVESNETITMSLATGSGYTNGHTTTCGSAAQTSATYTINDNDSRVTLRKRWANAVVGDDANVTIARSATVIDTLASDAGTANELDTDATTTPVVIGETLTLAETLSGSNVGSYNGAIACTGTADTNLADGLTIGTGETAITCTYTNTRTSQLLSLVKQWGANSVTGHSASVTTTGGSNNASFSSTAPTGTTGSSVTVYSGEVITLPAETYGGGGSAAFYNATLQCAGGTPLASGAVARSITISASTTATVCTYTNARKTATLTLRKAWVNAIVNNSVSVSATGLINAASLSSVANSATETDSSSAITVYVGESGTLGESFTAGSAAGYAAALACTGNSNALAGNVLTISTSDTAIVCTYTNTFITPLTITKSSLILSDGINLTNPKFIPGAMVQYCILITNPGTLAATDVSVSDPLPASTIFQTGTILSGTTCLGASDPEDEDATGLDETNPFGVSLSGSTIIGTAASLAPSASFAIVFEAQIN